MNIKTFDQESTLLDELTQSISSILSNAVSETGKAKLLLSGGSTPGPLYKSLSNVELDWKNIKVGLVDERFVGQDSEYSNETLIKQTLVQNKAKNAPVTGMVFDLDGRENNVKIANDRYATFQERTDVMILGMGPDGHTASLFPGDSSSEESLKGNGSGLLNTTAPSNPTERISCSMNMIADATHLFLFIKGANKLEVLKNTSENLPIHKLLKERDDIQIYYC